MEAAERNQTSNCLRCWLPSERGFVGCTRLSVCGQMLWRPSTMLSSTHARPSSRIRRCQRVCSGCLLRVCWRSLFEEPSLDGLTHPERWPGCTLVCSSYGEVWPESQCRLLRGELSARMMNICIHTNTWVAHQIVHLVLIYVLGFRGVLDGFPWFFWIPLVASVFDLRLWPSTAWSAHASRMALGPSFSFRLFSWEVSRAILPKQFPLNE